MCEIWPDNGINYIEWVNCNMNYSHIQIEFHSDTCIRVAQHPVFFPCIY